MNWYRRVVTIFCIALSAAVGCEQSPRAESLAPEGDAATTDAAPVSRSVESGPLRVTLEIDRDAAIVPDPLTLTLTVEAERGVDVVMPDIDEFLGDFVVQEVVKLPATESAVHRIETWSVLLEPVLPGDVQVPPMLIFYADRRERADGTRADVIDQVISPTLTVRVEQHLADVKDPATLKAPTSYTLLAWLLGIIAAMVVIALIARRLQRDEAPEIRPAEPTVPAHVWALAQLDMLAAEGLLQRGRVQEWYYRINAIVRQYIERRFGLMAGEQTSEEFLRDLQRTAMLSPDHKQLLQRFVSACDPVKYARHQPDAEEVRWVDASARDFVVQTAETGGDGERQEQSGSHVVPASRVVEQEATA